MNLYGKLTAVLHENYYNGVGRGLYLMTGYIDRHQWLEFHQLTRGGSYRDKSFVPSWRFTEDEIDSPEFGFRVLKRRE